MQLYACIACLWVCLILSNDILVGWRVSVMCKTAARTASVVCAMQSLKAKTSLRCCLIWLVLQEALSEVISLDWSVSPIKL